MNPDASTQESLERIARCLEDIAAKLARAIEIDENRSIRIIEPPRASMSQKVYEVRQAIETARLIDSTVTTPVEAFRLIDEWHAILSGPKPEDAQNKGEEQHEA